MPAARCQAAEYGAARGYFIDMKRLRIELRSKTFDLLLVYAQRTGGE